MEERKADEFAASMIEHVRDGAIYEWLRILDRSDGTFVGVEAVRRIEGASTPSNAVAAVLPDIVNAVLFHFLTFIESEKRLRVTWRGVDIVAEADSLSGELWTSDGWIAKLSKYPPGTVE